MNLARDRPAGVPAPEDLGDVLADIGDEAWTLLHAPAVDPVPLGALVVLDRRPGVPLRAERVPAAPAPILAAMMESGRAPMRQISRLDVASAIARQAVLVHVSAPLEASASEILAALLAAAGRDPA
jgi:hypothetical protein